MGTLTAEEFIHRILVPDLTVHGQEHGWVNFLEHYVEIIAMECCQRKFSKDLNSSECPNFYHVLAKHTVNVFHNWYLEEDKGT
jgi:hypothetical protein